MTTWSTKTVLWSTFFLRVYECSAFLTGIRVCPSEQSTDDKSNQPPPLATIVVSILSKWKRHFVDSSPNIISSVKQHFWLLGCSADQWARGHALMPTGSICPCFLAVWLTDWPTSWLIDQLAGWRAYYLVTDCLIALLVFTAKCKGWVTAAWSLLKLAEASCIVCTLWSRVNERHMKFVVNLLLYTCTAQGSRSVVLEGRG